MVFWTAFGVAFGTVLLAELPDKTMFATLVLTTRFRRPLAVWVGVVTAFSLHVVLAVAVGTALRRLPDTPVRLAVGLLFLVGGLVLLRSQSDNDTTADVAERMPFLRVAVTSASVVGLAEFGDFTQLSTAGISARYSAPIAVALGALAALATVASLAVTGGTWVVQHVPLRIVQRVAGVAFVGFGAITAISAVAAAT